MDTNIKIMKNKLYIFLIALISMSSMSCMKDNDNIYDGPDVVEFVPITASVKKGTVATPGTATAVVQLVGHQQNAPIDINYTIAGTGVQGTDYTLSGTAGKVTIPANSSSANIVITAIPANITTGTRTVILTLSGNSQIGASQNYKTYTLTITQ